MPEISEVFDDEECVPVRTSDSSPAVQGSPLDQKQERNGVLDPSTTFDMEEKKMEGELPIDYDVTALSLPEGLEKKKAIKEGLAKSSQSDESKDDWTSDEEKAESTFYSIQVSPSNRAMCTSCHRSIGLGVLRIGTNYSVHHMYVISIITRCKLNGIFDANLIFAY